MVISARRLTGLLIVLTIASVALVACQSGSGTNDESPPRPTVAAPLQATATLPVLAAISTTVPASASVPAPSPTPTLVPSQTRPSTPAGPPPDLNTDIRSVALEDIVFDTFDGSSKRLSEADNALIERLRDAIRPVYTPQYEDVSGGDWLSPDDTVLGYVGESGQAYAYPIKFLNFLELVNDVIDDVPLLFT